ncbi:MAG TPA: sugar phosphate isomerase/epimerase family protein [Ktedonobacteraceae bacterium]|nr:sugar phosphate isomerase/epimerase family protein [Ktedonobacteraceae bacterium]
MEQLSDFKRLSLNQITTNGWDMREAVDGCARAGIPWIGLWRDKVQACGLSQSRKLVSDAGLQVSSLCRGGWFPAASKQQRKARIDDNRRAIAEAVELGTDVLVLVCGPAPDQDIEAGRSMVADAIEQLLPDALAAGIKLGIEPLHPMFASDRSVIVTLAEANSLIETFQSPALGVVIDVYHVWWDPDVLPQIAQASGHILGYHVSDWPVPLPDVLLGRDMMGSGKINLHLLRSAVENAGYNGPIEVEIFNQRIWDTPGDEVLSLIKQRYLTCV